MQLFSIVSEDIGNERDAIYLFCHKVGLSMNSPPLKRSILPYYFAQLPVDGQSSIKQKVTCSRLTSSLVDS